jgi:hypothetical protein
VLQQLTCTSDGGGPAVAVRIALANDCSVFLLRPGEPPARAGRASGTPDYQTDARVLHYVERDNRLAVLDLVDGSHALSLREGWISVACSEPLSDLHLTRSHDGLELFASVPPTRLRLQGTGLPDVRYVELNHRRMPAVRAQLPDTLVIDNIDWGTPAGPVSDMSGGGAVRTCPCPSDSADRMPAG